MALQLPPNADLTKIPAGEPPSGVTSNFAHPNGSLQPAVIGVGAMMLVFSIASVILATAKRVRALIASDWTRLAGLILTIGYSICIFLISDNAIHQWDIPLSYYNTPRSVKLLYAQNVILGPCIFFSKLSILLLFLELFQLNKTTRWFIYGAIILDVLTYWPSIPMTSYFCAPHAGQPWDLAAYGNCANNSIWGVIQGSLAVVLDIYIFILPLPTVWHLQMGTRTKVAFTTVFATAFFGIVASAIALVKRGEIYAGKTADFNWLVYQTFICIMVENGAALIVSSMPTASAQAKVVVRGSRKYWSSYLSSKKSSQHSKIPSHAKLPSYQGWSAHSVEPSKEDHDDIEFQRLKPPNKTFLADSSTHSRSIEEV
ncbi:MAG: hypothetical protein M1831_006908 [Alyxoria varia]|nr:MAG: hypothetical protein M1831_006908 [Alyxoria varia]